MLDWFSRELRRLQEVKRDERGFTLIELLVVVIIIGILAAIAIPTFLGQRERARDAAAVANLRSGVSAMEAYGASDNPAYSYDSATPALLEDIEPSLTWDTVGTTPGNVGITDNNDAATGESRGTYELQVTSESGTVYTATANGNGEVAYEQDGEAFNP